MFKLFKATAIVSMATMAAMATGIARAKFTALTFGPDGVGIFSQAFAFQQLVITITTLGVGLGVTKYVAQYNAKGDEAKISGVISCVFWMQCLAALAVILISFVLSGIISRTIFSNRDYRIWTAVMMLGVPFTVLAVTGDTILLGFGNYRAFAKAKAISAFLSILPLFLFVYLMGLKGGFIYLAVSGVVTFLVYYYFVYTNIPREILLKVLGDIKNLRIRESIGAFAKDLLSYGGVSFFTGILGSASVIAVRALLIKYFNAEANGYYQVVLTISAGYIPFFTNGLWSYFYPKISTLEDTRRYSVEVNHALRMCIFGMIPCIVCLFLLRGIIIHAVFTDKFMISERLFSTQLFGDLFFMLYYIMMTSLIASTRLKSYLVFGTLYALSFIGVFLALKGVFALKAVTISYAVINLLALLAITYYHVDRMRLVIYKRNIKLFFSAVAVCVIILFFGKDNLFTSIAKALFSACCMILLLKNSEKQKLLSFASEKLKVIYAR